MAYYRRNLPHWHPDGRVLFITWRLHGSLPWHPRVLDAENPDDDEFRKLDETLDRAARGPQWLTDPQVAACVVEKIRRGHALQHYELHRFVVMPNHLHVLVTPKAEPRQLMKSLKGATARAANSLPGRTGMAFWQDESFDRWMRDDAEFQKTAAYIEQNPASARLVERPEDWPWSSSAASS
jgi:putative transposase